MSVTIKDVAKAAGVSVASVSRALNGHDSVTPDTRQRILDVAARLRYMPNSAARSLITQRTQTIGAVLPDLHGEFFSELIRGMDAAARARGLHLLVSSSHGSASEVGEVLRTLRGRVDGVLIMSPHADAVTLADNLPAALPTVLMNTRLAGGDYLSLSIDNYGGAYAMVEHLVACGHRRIAFVAGPPNNFDADERLRGYRDALKKRLPKQAPEILQGDFSEESGYRAGLAVRELTPRPQAIFAANDMMAIGCLFALKELGLDVPGDIALAGFDDIPIARFVSPPLTTMRVRIADLGSQALERLAAAIDGQAMPRLAHELECSLVVRHSSGAEPALETDTS
ncbi:LacI family DNA-binding transcriptional regulator [Dokdonella sp.]|uniref:LacI family DNA-binding transcriptional regulator n=1 Tax=Dokdonella sp. TaxID=2291710 RepID=UPI001B0A35C9|nr:LacI family DNA-binding transcriptional regulator [Dokdonella sp.]MBO9662808.1 LacI family DNA-binding transcriptional regulator [Dokdonella sp.]